MEEMLGRYYMHIDNGGFTLEVKSFYNNDGEHIGTQMEIGNSFYGYTTNSMKLHTGKDNSSLGAKDFRAMAEFLNEIAAKLPE